MGAVIVLQKQAATPAPAQQLLSLGRTRLVTL